MAADLREARSTTQLRSPPPFGYRHLPRPVQHHHHHHHLHHQHHPYEQHHQLQPEPQERMLEPEPEPYVKMEQEWEQEWDWRGKEEYVEPGKAEAPKWWEQYERPQAQQQAMQAEPMQAELMQAEPMQVEGRAKVCYMFCMPPVCDFGHVTRGVGRVFNVICVSFLCFPSRLWEQLHCPARFWRFLYRTPRRQGPQHHAGEAEEVADPREG